MFGGKIFRFYTVNITYASARYEDGSPLISRGFEAKCGEYEKERKKKRERERGRKRERESKGESRENEREKHDRKDL